MTVYTDGACCGNPGRGGWAFVTDDGIEASGSVEDTTNNRMEMEAAIQALRTIRRAEVTVCSDSEYLVKGMTAWLAKWKNSGWTTQRRQPVKNVDLWQALDGLVAGRRVTFRWVRGHNGDPQNERCDILATRASTRAFTTTTKGETMATQDEHVTYALASRADVTYALASRADGSQVLVVGVSGDGLAALAAGQSVTFAVPAGRRNVEAVVVFAAATPADVRRRFAEAGMPTAALPGREGRA